MSRLQDQEGRKIRLPGHGVTEIKPQGLMAVRPPQNSQKVKEGLYQPPQKIPSGCLISTEMVKALKSALIDANSAYGQKELSKKTVCSKTRLRQKCLVTTNNSQPPKCAPGVNKTTQKKPNQNNSVYIPKKKVSNVTTKMELISRMNMEGVVGPKGLPELDLSTQRHRPDCENKKKCPILPSKQTPPTRRGPRESRRKSLIAVPTSSPNRGKQTTARASSQVKSPAKNHEQETRRIMAVSLDRFILSRIKELKSTQVEKIVPDMTSTDFMRKLMSYSNMGFKESRYDRRTSKTPELDTIEEEF